MPFAHNLVHNLIVVFVQHAFVVTLLVAQDPKVLGALQLNLKLLCSDTDVNKENNEDENSTVKKNKKRKKDVFATDFVPLRLCGVPEDSGLGLADKVSK